MKRILFVDDEPNVLEGLRRLLRRERESWEMVFVDSGQRALAELAKTPFDVVVSDLVMPGMDGAAFLMRVRETAPQVARIVLSGHAEVEKALLALPVAHQYLAKPCDADVFRETIERATNVESLLHDPELRRIIGQTNSLPSPPQTYVALNRALADLETPLHAVAHVVEQDVALTAKILHLVNSGFFGRSRRLTSIDGAVQVLGTSMLRNLVLSAGIAEAFASNGSVPGFSLDALQRHAMLASSIAARLLDSRPLAEQAAMAALLHDVGKLVLAARLPDRLAGVLATAREQDRPMHVVEREIDGVTHAAIGAYLLELWGLPYPIVEAVALHHEPARATRERFDVLGAVHVANALAAERIDDGSEGCGEGLDMDFLASLGVADRLEAWREMAVDRAGAAQAS